MARCREEALNFVVLIHLIQCYNNFDNYERYVDLFCFIFSCNVCLYDDQGLRRRFFKIVVIFAVYQNLSPWVVGG